MLKSYLPDLKRELARRLPEEDVRTRLAEIESHLDAAVEAYAELDLGAVDAIATMGCPRRLARELACVATAKPHRWRVVASATALLAFGALMAAFVQLDSSLLTESEVGAIAVGLAATAFGAFRARRPAMGPLAAIAAALVVPMALGRALLCYELPIPGTARPAEGLSAVCLIYRPYVDWRLKSVSVNGAAAVQVADLLANVDPLPRRVAQNVTRAAECAAMAFVVVGGVDLAFAGLGLASLSRRRGHARA